MPEVSTAVLSACLPRPLPRGNTFNGLKDFNLEAKASVGPGLPEMCRDRSTVARRIADYAACVLYRKAWGLFPR